MSAVIHPNGSYAAHQVAEHVFGKCVEWFYRHRIRLLREDGFPTPISKFGQPRWSGAALLTWMQRPPVADQGPLPDGVSRLLDHRTQLLRARRRA